VYANGAAIYSLYCSQIPLLWLSIITKCSLTSLIIIYCSSSDWSRSLVLSVSAVGRSVITAAYQLLSVLQHSQIAIHTKHIFHLGWMCQTRPAQFEPQSRVGAGQDKVDGLKLFRGNRPTGASMEKRTLNRIWWQWWWGSSCAAVLKPTGVMCYTA